MTDKPFAGCLPQVWTNLEAMQLEIRADWYSCYSIWRMSSINQWMQNQFVSVMVTTQWRSWYWIVPYLDSEKEETHLDGQYKTLLCVLLKLWVRCNYWRRIWTGACSRFTICEAKHWLGGKEQNLVKNPKLLSQMRTDLSQVPWGGVIRFGISHWESPTTPHPP